MSVRMMDTVGGEVILFVVCLKQPACVCVNGCFFSGLLSNLCFEYCRQSDFVVSFFFCLVFVWSDNRDET